MKIRGGNEELALAIAEEIGMKNLLLDNIPKLPCRFELMQKNPLVILDGAHNQSKIKYTLERIKALKFNKLIVVIAIAEDKDHNGILKEIAFRADEAIFTRFLISQRECASPKKLLKIFLKNNPQKSASILLDPFEAYKTAFKRAGKNDLILITGSFFLAGELRKNWLKENEILRRRKV